ncbi:DUF1365 domain-containing protein [Rhizobium sp. RHZ02]|uniref:DUF1365 domain-containing protein n=1 Tax=Rhizobium sp. RHZ02 TaxID=2769306 RepID=UPI00177CDAF3|nr:DUF1365 domain-containing protein [Rhizobium sp. RHZ02]MBD9453653.1 DUF1365 domain-containing protein [Rhizobium sp. RHZ02]
MRENRITSMANNGPPPAAAGTLFPGKVMHQRLSPFGHRFSYSVFSLLVDIDRLGDLAELSSLLSVNRPGIVSFHERDHVDEKDEMLRQFVDRLLAHAGLEKPAARILLLAYPRMFGYAFNPLATYFAYDENERLIAIIYAVRNTFGERHNYVAPVLPGEESPAGIRQRRTKIFHVSPFMDMGLRYHFRILPPGKTVRVRIHETAGGQPVLAATFNADAAPLTDANLARCLLRFPFMTLKVMACIHWEALRLWLKGASFRTSPPPPKTSSYRDTT